MLKFVVFMTGLPQFLTKNITFHTTFDFLTFWLQQKQVFTSETDSTP